MLLNARRRRGDDVVAFYLFKLRVQLKLLIKVALEREVMKEVENYGLKDFVCVTGVVLFSTSTINFYEIS